MNRRARHWRIVLMTSLVSIYGCTVHLYHPTNPVRVDDSLLVVPETSTVHNAANSLPIAVEKGDVERPRIASPDKVLNMHAMGTGVDDSVQYMDSVGLQVQSNVDAYLNCYHKQADGAIIKVFPNRYSRRYWVYASQQLSLPDDRYYQFIADSAGSSEGFICLISQEDVLSKLPRAYQAPVFQKLPIDNFDAVYTLYKQATKQNLAARVISYTIQR